MLQNRNTWIVGSLLTYLPLALAGEAVQWPEAKSKVLENAIDVADGAFLGTMECYDVERPHENIIVTSGRVVLESIVWGPHPGNHIELGRRTFLAHGGSGPGWHSWEMLAPSLMRGTRFFPIVILWSADGSLIEIEYVLHIDQDNRSDLSRDLLSVRDLEREHDGTHLRTKLIEVAIDPQSTKLVWSYALRRLAGLEADLPDQFDLGLDQRIQQTGSADRLTYARGLLTKQIVADPSTYRALTRDEARVVLEKLLSTFEHPSSPNMAAVALTAFIDQPTRTAQFTEPEWLGIQRRIQAAVRDSNHAIYRLSPGKRADINKVLEELLGELPMPDARE